MVAMEALRREYEEAMEASRDYQFDELFGEVPSGLRPAVRDFLEEQHLNTLAAMASLHQDDLTEAFKAVPADFTLGHRAVVRRLCASAKDRVMTTADRVMTTTQAQPPSNPGPRPAHPQAERSPRASSPARTQRYQHPEDERQGSLVAWEAAAVPPQTPTSFQEEELQGSPIAWGKPRVRDELQDSPAACERETSCSPGSRQRLPRSERRQRSPGGANREASLARRCGSPTRRPAAPGLAATGGVISRAGARANHCGRETFCNHAGKDVYGVPHDAGFRMVNTTTLSISPMSPRASIGRSRRPELFSPGGC